MSRGIDAWFAEEILPLEGLLTRYVQRMWRNPSDIADLVQEIYIRVYESARTELPLKPRAFLLATARNLVIDQIRRRQVVAIDNIENVSEFEAMVDELSPERHVSAREELMVMAAVLDSLSDKCRQVLWLRRVEGMSQRETGEATGLSDEAVESQLARGIRALSRALFGIVPAKRERLP
jgi:RNA polymerase sigma factor (sigma-70 family)